MIKEKIQKMERFTYDKFLNALEKEIARTRKNIELSDEELDLTYKILSPFPTGCFANEIIEMDDEYSADLWNMKGEQIYCLLGERKSGISRAISYCQLKYVKVALEEIKKSVISDECELYVYSPHEDAYLYAWKDDRIIVKEHWRELDSEGEYWDVYEIICPFSCGFFHIQIDDDEYNKEIVSKLLR